MARVKREYEERQRKKKDKEEAGKAKEKDKSDEKAKEGGEKEKKDDDDNEKPKSPLPNETVRPPIGGIEAFTHPLPRFFCYPEVTRPLLPRVGRGRGISTNRALTCIVRASSPGDRDTSQQRGRRTSRVRVAQVSPPSYIIPLSHSPPFLSQLSRTDNTDFFCARHVVPAADAEPFTRAVSRAKDKPRWTSAAENVWKIRISSRRCQRVCRNHETAALGKPIEDYKRLDPMIQSGSTNRASG